MSKFKPGDWVNTLSSMYKSIPEQITAIEENDQYYIENTKGIGGWIFPEANLIPWKPKEGEWCWFYSQDTDIPVFDQFYKISKKGRFKSLHNHDCSMGKLIQTWGYCEPFIGELPSFLKE